jgi:lipopolysaccharide transport protein LptA
MRNCVVALVLLLCINLLVVSAWSEPDKGILAFMGDSNDPVHISSSKAEGRSLPRGYETILIGKVKVRQADMTLTCDRLITFYEQKEGSKSRSGNPEVPAGNIGNSENIKSITALGHVKIVQRDTVATAGKAVYDHIKRTITLSEDPRLRRGANTLQANTIVIFLEENRIEFEGGGKPIVGQLVPGRQKK